MRKEKGSENGERSREKRKENGYKKETLEIT